MFEADGRAYLASPRYCETIESLDEGTDNSA